MSEGAGECDIGKISSFMPYLCAIQIIIYRQLLGSTVSVVKFQVLTWTRRGFLPLKSVLWFSIKTFPSQWDRQYTDMDGWRHSVGDVCVVCSVYRYSAYICFNILDETENRMINYFVSPQRLFDLQD